MPGTVAICPAQIRAFAGDDWFYSFTLYEDGLPVNVSGATITAAVRTLTDQLAVPVTVQSAASSGASWSTGIVIVAFPNALTVGLTAMEYFIELDVFLNARYHTWPLIPVDVTTATITH